MKLTSIILLFLTLPLMILAQTVSCNFNPQTVEVNSMNTASFDPFVPLNQPILTRLSVNNLGGESRIDLRVLVLWNNRFLIGSVFQSINPVPTMEIITLTNRDLITNQSSQYFEQKPGSPSISVSDAINANALFGDAVLSGYFPDGDLQIKVAVRPYEDTPWELDTPDTTEQTFTIRIRNAGSITLVSPGVPLGQTPPTLSQNPIGFFWNAPETGMSLNRPILTIREYSPIVMPNSDNVELTGNLFYETPTGVSAVNGFSEFLPFTSGNYYAWKVSKALANEYNPQMPSGKNLTGDNTLSSEWFIFRYTSETETDNTISEFQARLNMLNNNRLLSLYSEGYIPLGVILFEGRTYSGQDALNLIDVLLGQDIEVELKD
jgi:hypothetical protein